jgi:hypothetical protein
MFVAKSWLNCIMDDKGFNYMTNMIEKTLLMYAHVIGIFLLVIYSQNLTKFFKKITNFISIVQAYRRIFLKM